VKTIAFMHAFINSFTLIHTHSHSFTLIHTHSHIAKDTGLFCKKAQWKRRYSAKETYDFIDPTDRSHPILSYQTLISVHDIKYIYIHALSRSLFSSLTHSHSFTHCKYRVAKTHRTPYLYRSLSAKEPYN